MTTPEFEYFDHVADVGIRIRAATFEELLSTAARALAGWIGPAPEGPDDRVVEVVVEAEDQGGLLVRWLQEVLFRFQVERFYFTGTGYLTVEGNTARSQLLGRSWGDRDAASFQEVKAVTYHQIEVSRTGAFWQASVILDL
jgi:SHS2 domain-containing protein